MRLHIGNLRTRVLSLAAITVLILASAIGYSLHVSWKSLCRSTTSQMQQEACTTSSLLKMTLVDASKILDTARILLEANLKTGQIDPKKAHDILRYVVESFSIYNTPDAFGLLLYLDASGQLIARSGEYPSAPLDLSERYYYTSLRDDPLRKFSMGKLRKAATTGRIVFHLSMPLYDGRRVFQGVVAIQMEEQEFQTTLNAVFDGRVSHICAMESNGETLLRFPSPKSAPSVDDPVNRTLQRLHTASTATQGVIYIKGGAAGFPKTVYAAFDRDPLFGCVAWSSILESDLFAVFIRQNRSLIVFSLLAIVASGLLFVRFYKQSRRLEQALNDANIDHMTLLANRRGMESEVERLWRDASRTGRQISILFIDIDHFKNFNDLHGHKVGDRVLKSVARCIHESIERPLDFCSRWGGEEFLTILPETSVEESVIIATRIRERIAQMDIKVNGISIPTITVSIGIATSDQGNVVTADDLIQRADHAMLKAKAEGRDRIVISQES